jgi:hypothetical protein
MAHQLAGEVDEILVAARARIVFGDRLPKLAASLQLRVEVDRALHEVVAELARSSESTSRAELRARVVQRREHADEMLCLAALLHQLQRLHHLRQAVQAEEAGLDGTMTFVAGAQRVERDQPTLGGQVDDRPLVGAADAASALGQAVLAAARPGEDLLERGELDVAGREVEVAGDLPDDLADFAPACRPFSSMSAS